MISVKKDITFEEVVVCALLKCSKVIFVMSRRSFFVVVSLHHAEEINRNKSHLRRTKKP